MRFFNTPYLRGLAEVSSDDEPARGFWDGLPVEEEKHGREGDTHLERLPVLDEVAQGRQHYINKKNLSVNPKKCFSD